MPALPVVPQVCKLNISGTYHDSTWLNIYHVHYSGSAPSASDILNYLTGIVSPVDTAYAAEMSADCQGTLFEMWDLTTDTGAFNSKVVTIDGVRAGDFNPSNVCMVASQEIARRYRGGHPRKYLPWGTSGTMASGSTRDWDAGFVADCQSKFDTMCAAIVGITEGATTWDQLVNVSYVTAGARRSTAQVDPITAQIVRTRICSQRRRLGKVGG